MSRYKRLAVEGSWIVAGQIAVVAASIVQVRVLTEYLEPTQYGQLALALTLGTLIGQVAFSGSMPGIMRYYPIAAEKGEAHEYLNASIQMMGYGILASLVLSGLLLFGLPLFGKADMLALVSLTILFTILGNFNTAQNLIQNAARQRKIVAIHSAADAWLRIFFAAGFLIWLGNSAQLVVVAYIVSLMLVLMSQAMFIRRLIPKKAIHVATPSNWSSQIWNYSKPFVYINTFSWVQASSDRWALDTFSTAQDVGLYAVLLQLGYTPIGMVAGLVATLVGPILFQRAGDASDPNRNSEVHKHVWQITAITLLITILGCIFAYLFHAWIFRVLVATQFHSVSYLLPWTILAGGIFAAGQLLALKLWSNLNTRALVWPKIVTSSLGAILSFAGAYFAGLPGVIYGAITFSIFQLLWLGWLSRHAIDLRHKG